MAKTFTFELVSPEQLLVSEEVEQVVLPGTEGEMTVMADHSPLMTSIKPGLVTVVRPGGDKEQFIVYGGFADVTQTICRLLAEEATRVAEFEPNDLKHRIEQAQTHLENEDDPENRTKAEEFLHQLTTLQGIILPP